MGAELKETPLNCTYHSLIECYRDCHEREDLETNPNQTAGEGADLTKEWGHFHPMWEAERQCGAKLAGRGFLWSRK